MNTECSPKLHCQLKLLLCRLLVRPATLLMLFFSSVFPSIVWRYLVPIVAALIPLVKNEMVSSQWYRTYMTYGSLTLTTTLNLKSTTSYNETVCSAQNWNSRCLCFSAFACSPVATSQIFSN